MAHKSSFAQNSSLCIPLPVTPDGKYNDDGKNDFQLMPTIPDHQKEFGCAQTGLANPKYPKVQWKISGEIWATLFTDHIRSQADVKIS